MVDHNVAPSQGGGAPPPPRGTVLTAVGDIGVTDSTVITPNGTYPLKGTTWIVANQTQTIERIPAYAIVLAIIFAFLCLIGLLFLLVKERKIQGFMQVSVQGPGLYYATQVPISDPAQVPDVERRVNYIRQLVARLISV